MLLKSQILLIAIYMKYMSNISIYTSKIALFSTYSIGLTVNTVSEMFVFVGFLASPTVPVIVSVTQRPDRNFKRLPHRIQSIFHHFCFVADGIPVRHTKLLAGDRITLKTS